jgi:aryl-alcohol dehydrogenase-like predicted oxidoreductase
VKLGLGSAQFGMNYGVSNRGGQTPSGEVARILALARERGLTVIDTAPGYGDSETVLGAVMADMPGESGSWAVVSKTPGPVSPQGHHVATAVEEGLRASLVRLRREWLYGLLVHNPQDLLAPGGERVHTALLGLRERGLVRKIGVSVYDAAQLEAVLQRFAVDLVQLPLSVFDQRLLKSGHLAALKERGIEVHARSAFLQGALLMPPEELPPHLVALAPGLARFRRLAEGLDASPAQAALAWVNAVDEVDAIIVGVNNAAQLAELLPFEGVRVEAAEFAPFAVTDENLVNPARWTQ